MNILGKIKTYAYDFVGQSIVFLILVKFLPRVEKYQGSIQMPGGISLPVVRYYQAVDWELVASIMMLSILFNIAIRLTLYLVVRADE
jgi:hypothetical protein